ncbi:MAG: hypothetical protein H0U26_02730 [Acidimicrobiia bacterium]|nr:hypothetical protein [Acidimicrobiia bacterium]
MTIISGKHQEAATPLAVPPPRPEFSVAVRGYERAQVDEYASDQLAWATEVEARLQAAERAFVEANEEIGRLQRSLQETAERELASPPRSVEAIGDRFGHILQTSWDLGEQLRTEAEADASEIRRQAAELMEDTREQARQHLEQTREHADQHRKDTEEAAHADAEAIVAAAKAEGERITTEAHAVEADALARRDVLEERVAALASHHAAAMEEVARVRSALDRTLGVTPADDGTVDLEHADDTRPQERDIDLSA